MEHIERIKLVISSMLPLTFRLLAAVTLIASFTHAPAVLARGGPVRVSPDDGGAGSTYGPFRYDPSGNIISIGSNTSATSQYTYDPLSRVVASAVQRGGHLQQQGYSYDVYGNLIATTSAGAMLQRAVDPSTNRLGSSAPLHAQYDQVGNMTGWVPPGQAAVREYAYDALNMITREAAKDTGGPVVHHAYSPSNERIWTETATASAKGTLVTTRYTLRDLQGAVLREYGRSAACVEPCALAVEREYAYRDGALLGVSTPEAKHYYSLDHLGTPRIVTDGSGYIIAEHTYFPFGVEITDNSPTDGPLRFTGHERDPDVNGHAAGALDYMHARYYSAVSGRFLSVDPVLGDLSEPQTWNRYAYAVNNPLRYLDPRGLKPCPVVGSDGVEREGECIEVEGETPEVEPQPNGPDVVHPIMPIPDHKGPIQQQFSMTLEVIGAAVRQSSTATSIFWQNYRDMREANTIGADHYFHCMANCQASRCGGVGVLTAHVISDAREWFDLNVKRDPERAAYDDQVANRTGRNGNSRWSCEAVCAGFRPNGLER
jgi:RHS repeat-associated protein